MGLFDQMAGSMLSNMLGRVGPEGAGALIDTLLSGPMASALPGVLDGEIGRAHV